MKKLFILLAAALMAVNVLAADNVTDVAGVRFGASKDKTIKEFMQRGLYGHEQYNEVHFYNVSFGGWLFRHVTLYFQENKFISVLFEMKFKQWQREEAMQEFNSICKFYREKYSTEIISTWSETDKSVFYGAYDENYLDGKIPPICVSCDEGRSNGGDFFYYINISYYYGRVRTSNLGNL